MNRPIRIASWLFFAAIMYLILSEALAPWISLPALGNIGFTLVFVLFALFHCLAAEGPRRTAIFFAVSAVVSYFLEEIGVRSGLVYGHYHYSDMLGPKLGHVPVIIPLAWFMMIYPSWTVAKTIFSGINSRALPGMTALALVAAWIMTAWDVIMDPGMSAAGNWVWEQGGPYFGVPRHNYVGWLLTTFLAYWITALLWRNAPRAQNAANEKIFGALPVVVYSFFAFRYVTASRPVMQIIALFAMGLPSLIALVRISIAANSAATEP